MNRSKVIKKIYNIIILLSINILFLSMDSYFNFKILDNYTSTLYAEISKDFNYESALLKYNESDYQQALKYIDSAMNQEQFKKLSFIDQEPYLLLLSKIKANLNDTESCKNILKDIILKDKYCFEAYIVLSKLYRSNNQYEASIQILNKGLDRLLSYRDEHKNNIKDVEKEFYNNLSLNYLYSFDNKNASYYLNKSIDLDPKYEPTILVKAIYLYTIKDYTNSLSTLDRVLTDPNNNKDKNLCFKYYLKSKILDNLSQYDQSLSYIKMAIDLDKDNMDLKLDLARLFKDKFHNINEAYLYFNEVKNLGNIDQKKVSNYYLDTMDL